LHSQEADKDQAIDNLEYQHLATLENEVREELRGQADEAAIDAQVARDLARHTSMWSYLEMALAARITKLTEYLENVGKVDVQPILLALQKSMAGCGTETLRNAARLDENFEVDVLTEAAQLAKKAADKELREIAPLEYANGKQMEKGAAGRDARTQNAPKHKDWAYAEDNVLPPCLCTYTCAGEAANADADGAADVDEINDLHDALPANIKDRISEDQVMLAWTTEASNGLTVEQRKAMNKCKDDKDAEDVIQASVQRTARSQTTKRKRVAPTTERGAAKLPPVPPLPRDVSPAGARPGPKKIKPTLDVPADQLYKPLREYMLNIYGEVIPPELKTFEAVLGYVENTLSIQLGNRADVVSIVEAYRNQRAESSAFIGVNDTKLGQKQPRPSRALPKPVVKDVLCVVCEEVAAATKVTPGPFLQCATCSKCTHHKCINFQEGQVIPGLLLCSEWRCTECKQGARVDVEPPEVGIESQLPQGEELLPAGGGVHDGRGVFVGDLGLRSPLKPHQVQGVQFILKTAIGSVTEATQGHPGTGCILAHACGTGKTLQAIAAISAALLHNRVSNSIRTCLVVAPVNVVHNWVNEWKTWAPKPLRSSVSLLDSATVVHKRIEIIAKWQQKGGLLICGSSLFQSCASGDPKHRKGRTNEQCEQLQIGLLNPGADMVVLDEGHMMKNDKSLLAKGLTKIKTKRRVLLTGTPIQNNLKEYYVMLNWVREKPLGTIKTFTQDFEEPIRKGQDGNASEEDKKKGQKAVIVLQKLLVEVVHRRDHDATLEEDLPPKQEYVVSVRLSELQRQLYTSYLDWLDTRKLDQKEMTLFNHQTRLCNIWSHPSLLRIGVDNDRSGDDELIIIDDDNDNDPGGASRPPTPPVVPLEIPHVGIPQLDGEGPEVPWSSAAPPGEQQTPAARPEGFSHDEQYTGWAKRNEEANQTMQVRGLSPLSPSNGVPLRVSMDLGGVKPIGVKQEAKEEGTPDGIKLDGPSEQAPDVSPPQVPSDGASDDDDDSDLLMAAGTGDPASMSSKELKALIAAAGLSIHDCIEKSDLVARAQEAQQIQAAKPSPCKMEEDNAAAGPSEPVAPTLREADYTWTKEALGGTSRGVPKEDMDKMGRPSVGSYLTEQQASYAASHLEGNPTIAAMKAKRWLNLQCPAWRRILGDTEELDAVEHSGKLTVLLELIQSAQEQKDKLLVFSQWTGVLDVIQAMLEAKVQVNPDDDLAEAALWQQNRHFYRIQGETPSMKRQQMVEAFNQPESAVQLCLLSTKAAGMGINLTAANRVVIFDSSWNPSQDAQALCRTYRYGQTKPVFVYRLLAAGTMEEKIYQRAVMKLGLSLSILDEKQTKQIFTQKDSLLVYDDDREEAGREEKLTDQKVVRDKLIAGILLKQENGSMPALIKDLDEHDSLLQEIDHEMTSDEQRQVWDEYRAEEERKAREKDQKKLEKKQKEEEKKQKEIQRVQIKEMNKQLTAQKAKAAIEAEKVKEGQRKEEARRFELLRQQQIQTVNLQGMQGHNSFLAAYTTKGSYMRVLFENNYQKFPQIAAQVQDIHAKFGSGTPEQQSSYRRDLNGLIKHVCEASAPANPGAQGTLPTAPTGVKAPKVVSRHFGGGARASKGNESDRTETDEEEQEEVPTPQFGARLLPEPDDVAGPSGFAPPQSAKRKAEAPPSPGTEPEAKKPSPDPIKRGSVASPILLD